VKMEGRERCNGRSSGKGKGALMHSSFFQLENFNACSSPTIIHTEMFGFRDRQLSCIIWFSTHLTSSSTIQWGH